MPAGNDLLIVGVDDDPKSLVLLKRIVESGGFTFQGVSSGKDLLKLLKTKRPRIILMDIMMPEMDGYEAMAHIRSQPRFAALPVLALTAKAMKDDRAKCLDAGANDYCSKPIDMSKLTSLMRVWLHK